MDLQVATWVIIGTGLLANGVKKTRIIVILTAHQTEKILRMIPRLIGCL